MVYDTKLGDFVKTAEQANGYDDYINMLLFLMLEINNPQSKWKPYLDILPRQPSPIAFDYWNKRGPIEDELFGQPILSKISI